MVHIFAICQQFFFHFLLVGLTHSKSQHFAHGFFLSGGGLRKVHVDHPNFCMLRVVFHFLLVGLLAYKPNFCVLRQVVSAKNLCSCIFG